MSDNNIKIWPCLAFARGKCDQGDDCPNRHESTARTTTKEPCRFFHTIKGCFKGDKCRLLHDKNIKPTSNAKPTSSYNRVEEARFRRWLYQIPKPGSTSIYGIVQTREFFSGGWELFEKGDIATIQRIIKKLATEEGLVMIKALTDVMEDKDSPYALQTFKGRVVPFFQTISHPDVQSSLILETPTDTIMNFLFGPSGRRAKTVLEFTAKGLRDMAKENNEKAQEEYSTAFTASVIVFRGIVELNQAAQLITEFTTIVQAIESFIPSALPLQTARRALIRIKQRLGIGAEISDNKASRPNVEPAYFELEQDMAGELSDYGPRHDNDHADICNIRILPTADEIKSDRPEYLPSANSSTGHLTGVKRMLDRQFRLLRQDTVGQLRDIIRVEQETLAQVQRGNMAQLRQNKTRHFTYTNVRLLELGFSWRRGFTLVTMFDQPAPSNLLVAKNREQWWEDSKRLRPDTLVTLVTPDRVFFFTVCDIKTEGEPKYPGLHIEPEWATVGLLMVEPNEEDLTWICMHVGNDFDSRQSLVELPAVLLASFKPTLQALQKMFRTPDIPFSEFLAPDEASEGIADVPPPEYAQKPGFEFNLGPIAGGERITFAPGKTYDHETLQKKTTLDDAQKMALLNALSRGLALIQGPPGTGKSFTGVATIGVLLKSKTPRFGPIICVCYTNHALDQLLEHLLDHGVSKIIRMGSRSKSDRLQQLNLFDMRKQVSPTKEESHEQWEHYRDLNSGEQEIQEVLADIQNRSSWISIRTHLQFRHRRHFDQLFWDGVDKDGYIKVRSKSEKSPGHWLKGGAVTGLSRPVSELLAVPVWDMNHIERNTIYGHWIKEQRDDLVDSLLGYFNNYTTEKSGMDKCRQEVDIRCLQHADVIGVTSSGLAKNLQMLQRVGSKVVVCEEAGEVLEAQTLTVLLPTVEHVILIGDHQQLRPQINTYELRHDHPEGQRLSFDISLFERLVDPKQGHLKLPYSTLEIQRRMHPSIAELVRRTLYPKLKDHAQVKDYPNIDGMRDRLFWLDHQHYEDAVQSTESPFSKTNSYEVDMVEALVSYLVKQGTFKHEDIAVLTPYLGQLRLIRNQLRSSFEIVVGDRDIDELENEGMDNPLTDGTGVDRVDVRKTSLLGAVRVATVDNFQGEEAKVIIISLVRSNSEKKCGFLKTSNRINVLLSRARHGMYIIGNAETASSVPMWKDIISILDKNGNRGASLALRCPRHEDTPTTVSMPDHFAVFAPEGGCNLKCAWRLKCGHACMTKCHSELLHSAVRCLERCQRTREGCDHECPKYCGDPCPALCEVPVPNVTLPCGHIPKELPCHQAQAPETARCQTFVEVTLPRCDHKAKVRCHQLPITDAYRCRVVCDGVLPCGHNCKRRCCECVKVDGSELEQDHGKCNASCDRPYTTCSHSCKNVCHGDEPCPLCNETCEVHCIHSQCKKRCCEPCVPCAEECSWHCLHRGKCQLPCAVPCGRLPCSKRCELLLECGHRCPSVCGEPCPTKKFCQQCGDASAREQEVDYILGETYGEVDLDENPCIIPSCGHILTMESMDGYFDMASYYEMSRELGKEGTIVALKSRSEPFSIKELKNCPMCRAPLRNVHRYGRIVRRALVDEATKKFIVWANAKFVPLAEQLERCVTGLSNSKLEPKKTRIKQAAVPTAEKPLVLNGASAKQTKAISLFVRADEGFRNVLNLLRDIKNFLRDVDEKEQPFKRVHDLMDDAHRHRGVNTGNAGLHENPEILQVRNRILTTVLLLRCEYAILATYLSLVPGKATADFDANRAYCDKLIDECEQRKQPRNQVEGLLYWARFAALECVHPESADKLEESGLRPRAREYLDVAVAVCYRYPEQTTGLLDEIEETQKMLRDATFYVPVSNEERAAVYAAMAQDFRGTGHWYYCQNGHPFTVGECGMPMESSRCPECGSAVGGQDHRSIEGVRAATDLDADFANLAI